LLARRRRNPNGKSCPLLLPSSQNTRLSKSRVRFMIPRITLSSHDRPLSPFLIPNNKPHRFQWSDSSGQTLPNALRTRLPRASQIAIVLTPPAQLAEVGATPAQALSAAPSIARHSSAAQLPRDSSNLRQAHKQNLAWLSTSKEQSEPTPPHAACSDNRTRDIACASLQRSGLELYRSLP